MNILALFPAFIALVVSLHRSPAHGFLYVYIPTLLIFPDYYRWIAPGLPDPNFHQGAILAVAAVYFWKKKTFRFSYVDLMVLGFAFCVGFSQYLATGYSDAQNLIFSMLCSVILPYVIAKELIEPGGLRVATAKIIVLVLLGVTAVCVYEFRFILNPFQLWLRPFFPGLGMGWVSNIRWGFGRVAGPYGHAILAGIIFAVGFRLHCWLQSGGHWKLTNKPVWVSRFMKLTLVAGMIMTLSRGPWIGSVLGWAVALLGRVRKMKKVLLILAGMSFLIGVPAYLIFSAYVAVDRSEATSLTQETAAYRKELFEKYVDIAIERSAWGWGQNTVPVVDGMTSVDNYWLLLALMHGIPALSLFFLLVSSTAVRLGLYGLGNVPKSDETRLAFDLAGILIMYTFSVTTVYLGTQSQPLLFLILGWAEGLLMVRSKAVSHTAPAVRLTAPAYRFERVIW